VLKAKGCRCGARVCFASDGRAGALVHWRIGMVVSQRVGESVCQRVGVSVLHRVSDGHGESLFSVFGDFD
jgi:hypothetical protein